MRRKWLKTGLMAIVIGSGLVSLSYSLPENTFEEHIYTYESKGIINVGESRYLYAAMPTYKEFLGTIGMPKLSISYTKIPVFERLDYDITKTEIDKGEFYDISTFDGSQFKGFRRYLLMDETISINTEQNPWLWLMLSTGIMLIVGGITSLFISRRW